MAIDQEVIDKSREFVSTCMRDHGGKEYTYHNYEHIDRVEQAARKLADAADLSEKERQLLILAAIYHDVGFCFDAKTHEKKGAEIAAEKLKEYEVDEHKISAIKELIQATKMDWVGDNKLALLLRDADLSGLADKNFYEITDGLRKEREFLLGCQISEQQWIETNIAFFKSHKYLTKEGKKLFKKRKRKNRKILQKMAKKNVKENLTISSSKSAQTQIKTSLRNHIDLSSIADNKANMMLSINAIVLTVGMPLLIDTMRKNPKLLLPTIIIGIASVISIVFATLSTRPHRMSGLTDRSLIQDRKTNLFFFGNFYNMEFEEYEEGMKEVVADTGIMDNSITRDLFYLGKTLGSKFAYLRICYGVFTVGIVFAALAFGVVLVWG